MQEIVRYLSDAGNEFYTAKECVDDDFLWAKSGYRTIPADSSIENDNPEYIIVYGRYGIKKMKRENINIASRFDAMFPDAVFNDIAVFKKGANPNTSGVYSYWQIMADEYVTEISRPLPNIFEIMSIGGDKT